MISVLRAKSLASLIKLKISALETKLFESVKITYPQGMSMEEIKDLYPEKSYEDIIDELAVHQQRLIELNQIIRKSLAEKTIKDKDLGFISISQASDIASRARRLIGYYDEFLRIKNMDFSERSKNIFITKFIADKAKIELKRDELSLKAANLSADIDKVMNQDCLDVTFFDKY